MKKSIRMLVISLLAAAGAVGAQPPDDAANRSTLVERGRYLARVAGCNDCHTPGYIQATGQVDESLWLTGDPLGWRGPWGTSYASNLRLLVKDMTRPQWLALVNAMQPRPPMPWFNVRAMTREDQSALFEFLKYLGPAGSPTPAFVPPEQSPPPPFVQFPG